MKIKRNIALWIRKLHRWGAIAVFLPFSIVLLSGILLQLKKEIAWVQPPTTQGVGKSPRLPLDQLLAVAQMIPDAEIKGWEDIDRIDVRPDYGIAKVQCKNHWEIQIDWFTGKINHAAYRRSDVIESLHVGSWFHPNARLWGFLPSAFIVLGLLCTGLYLLFHRIKLINLKSKI